MVNEKEYLALINNGFSGSIPDWIGSLILLKHLDLGENELTGEWPIEICDLVDLEELSMYENHFNGIISFSSNTTKALYLHASAHSQIYIV
jgi:hypothetical protein